MIQIFCAEAETGDLSLSEPASGSCRNAEKDRLKAVKELDEEMIKRNLSPGGNADMLALAFLLDSWERISHNL